MGISITDMDIKTTQVGNYAKKSAVISNKSETVGFAIDTMLKYNIRSFPILTDDGKLLGIITATDILKCMYDTGNLTFLKIEIGEIMTKNLIISKSDDSLRNAILLMYNSGISGVPVVSDGNLDGLFTEKDILLLEELWQKLPDNSIIGSYGIGRLVSEDDIVTENHTIWQVADKIIQTGQKQVLFKSLESGQFKGVITILSILGAVVKLLISEEHPIDLQTTGIENVIIESIEKLNTPIKISEVRHFLNSNSLEAVPIFDIEESALFITEKDLIGYVANHI